MRLISLQPFYFPEEAGYPVGGPNDLSFYTLQIHYDNPTHKIGKFTINGLSGLMGYVFWDCSVQTIYSAQHGA